MGQVRLFIFIFLLVLVLAILIRHRLDVGSVVVAALGAFAAVAFSKK